ncbi:MAG: cupin domain-containing protein [Candidatus Saccharimonadaceae bacterium]
MGVAELQPGRKVKPHIHSKGIELFHILKGEGKIHTGFQEEETVIWNDPIKIKGGDIFSIEPGVIHQLSNSSDKQSLFLIFSCPLSHLCTDIVAAEDFI